MKKQTLCLIALLSILLLSCDLLPLKLPPVFQASDITDSEEYAVINAVIDTLAGDNLVHVMQHTYTVSDSDWQDLGFYLEQVGKNDSLMRVDYLAKNDTTHYLDPDSLTGPAEGFTTVQFVYYFASSSGDMGFTGYYRDYPSSSGIIDLHRPGFNADADMAMLEVFYMHNNLGAEMYLCVLGKSEGRWQVTNLFLMGES